MMLGGKASQEVLDWFFNWYDDLHGTYQNRVDDLADELGYPYYEDCTEDQLIDLHDQLEGTSKYGLTSSCVEASDDIDDNSDLYVVKIWYEIDPGHDVAVPQAAEEIFFIKATSPDEAKEYARQRWDGPIDRIDIVDVNPEDVVADNEDYIPFDASSCIDAATDLSEVALSQVSFDFMHDGYYTIDDIDRIIRIAFDTAGVEYVASSYESVDYSMYPDLADANISQASADFKWNMSDTYDQHIITDVIRSELAAIGYELLGIDYRSLDD